MGKSFLIRSLVSQVPGQKAHVVVLDTSQDFEGYWTLPSFCGEEDIPINRLKVKSPEIQLNPLRALAAEGERGETPEEIAMGVSGVVGEICHLQEPQAMYLSTAIVRFLKEKSGGDSMEEFIRYVMDNRELNKRVGTSIAKLEYLRLAVTFGNGGIKWNVSEPGITVIDFNGIYERVHRMFVVELLLGELWGERIRNRGESRIPLVVVLDECQNFRFRDSSFLMRILREGRKFGIGGWFATQWVDDRNAAQALEQAALQIHFWPGDKKVRALASQLKGYDPKQAQELERMILKMGVGDFLYQTPEGRIVRGSVR